MDTSPIASVQSWSRRRKNAPPRVRGVKSGLLFLALFASACDGTKTDDASGDPSGDPSNDRIVDVTKDVTFARATQAGIVDRDLDVYVPQQLGVWPVVVVLHGGSASKDFNSIVKFSKLVAEQGVVVFAPSYSPTTPDAVVDNNGRALREILETATCAIRYAGHHAGSHSGDPSRLTVIGQSAGGLFGGLASLLEEEMDTVWDDFEALRGGPSTQMTCVEDQAAVSVTGFVGFNGAHFILKGIDLPQTDPELWSIANAETYIGKNASLILRFIIGKNDPITPNWHVEDVHQFAVDLRASGYDADTTHVFAGHDFNFISPAWDETLEVVLGVVR